MLLVVEFFELIKTNKVPVHGILMLLNWCEYFRLIMLEKECS